MDQATWGSQSRENREAGTWYSSLRGHVCDGMLWALCDLDRSSQSFWGVIKVQLPGELKGVPLPCSKYRIYTAVDRLIIDTLPSKWFYLTLIEASEWTEFTCSCSSCYSQTFSILRPLTHICGVLFCFWKIPLLQTLAIFRKRKWKLVIIKF